MKAYLFVAVLAIFGMTSIRHAISEEIPTVDQLKTQISILEDQNTNLRKKITESDGPLYDKYREIQIAEYEYKKKLMEINVRIFDEQSRQTHVIMWLVVIVVLSGICFSALQLWKATLSNVVQTSSELEMSAEKIRVTSSVIGVTVLTISVVFLYIYIKEVYAIKVIDPFQPDINKPETASKIP